MQQSSFFLIISTISILCPSIHAQRELFQPCPLLGPFVPAPIIDSSSPSIKAATESVNKLLDKYIVEADGRFGPISPNTTSFSIALFAGSNYIPGPDDLPFFYEYHHTASNMAGDGLDKDSVFALGDLTQLFTVYTQLAELGDQVWSHSIVDFLPELRDVSTISSDAIHAVHWEDVTLGSLAGHVAGIARDCMVLSTIIGRLYADKNTANACTIDKVCDRDTFIPALAGRRPVTLPDSTPIASNAAFQALAFAVQTQTKQPFAQVFRDRISTPLGLNATHFLSDEFPLSLFGNGLANSTLKGEPASLGLLSTISDLATAGRAMLTSKLLPPSTTRRWLKPFTSTSNLRNAVGRPWEIYHYGSSPTDPIIDIYTKTGSMGRYSSYFGLVPSHDVGFAILAVDTHKEAPDLNAYADITLGK
jgi:CubicO group peptidase (beta-lactamase class C family)